MQTTQVFQQRPEGRFAGDVEALLEPEGIGLGQKIDIDAGAQEPLVGQSVVGAGVDDHPPALVAEVEVGAALPGGALRGQTRLGGRRLFAGVGREGETGQGHPEQAEHDGKNAQRIENAEPDLAHGSGLLSAEMVFQTVVCAKENCLRQECRIFTPGCCTLAGQMCYTSIVSGRFPPLRKRAVRTIMYYYGCGPSGRSRNSERHRQRML